ncbi:MAG TPA: CHAT domain-containing tetratricopeptide repeat protein [Pyrinomonadaceae bacterium]|nr:CHAT domain-containing tetratricopeptide repeat protein [Pyrinomonadaceae bacterium]
MSSGSSLRRLRLCLAAALLLIPSVARAQGEATALELNAPVEREIAPGESHDYKIELRPGQLLHLAWGVQKFGLVLTVFAPDGRVLMTVRHNPHSEPKIDVAVVADAPGAYRLNVRPSGSASGRYQLTAVEVRAADELDRKRFSAQAAGEEAMRLEALSTAQGRVEAVAKYEEEAALWREAGDRNDEAAALIRAGRLHVQLAQYQKALDVFNRALSVAREAGYRQGQLEALGNMATVYGELGDTQKSLELNRQMLPVARELGARDDEGSILVNIGLAYENDLHDTKTALENYSQALQIFQEVGDRLREGVALNNIGSAYRRNEDFPRALDYYQRALALRRETKNRQGEAATLSNIGATYQAMGEHQKALDYSTQANALVHAVGYRRGEAVTLLSMAEALDGLGRTADALGRMESAIGIIESMRSDLVGDEDRASFFASSGAYYDFYIELLMKLQRQDASRGYEAAALQASERAHARILLDQLNEVRVNLRQDVDPALLKEERQVQQQVNAATLARWELEREAHTAEQLAASQKRVDDLLASYQELEGRIRASSPRYAALTRPQLLGLAEIQKQVLDPDTLLLEYSLGRDRGRLWVVAPDSAASFALPARADIERAARGYYELLTARAQHLKFETPEEKRARVARADAELPAAAAELSRQLLGPAAALLGSKRLLVVSDGALHLVPFAALPDPSEPSRPLVFKHEVVNVPSASALAELRRGGLGRPSAGKTLAVLADPVFEKEDERVKAILSGRPPADPRRPEFVKAGAGSAAEPDVPDELTRAIREAGVSGEGGAIPRLPYTRREANAIAALIPPQERVEALDFDASRATATSEGLGRFRFIHFATHGLLNNEHPELSGVVLSLVDRQGRAQDGFLRASEIFRLRLPVELVVLSGCRTGLGKETRGEGLVGLTQGFLYAGASRVMVSLWDVNDAATAELMAKFYRAMLGREHLSPAAALRAAQISVWQDKRWQSPYYWSAFVLQGEPR